MEYGEGLHLVENHKLCGVCRDLHRGEPAFIVISPLENERNRASFNIKKIPNCSQNMSNENNFVNYEFELIYN